MKINVAIESGVLSIFADVNIVNMVLSASIQIWFQREAIKGTSRKYIKYQNLALPPTTEN